MTAFAEKVLQLSSMHKRLIVGTYDFFAMGFSLWLAFSLRFGEAVSPAGPWGFFIVLGALVSPPLLFYSGLYRVVIQYLGHQALWLVIKGVSFAVFAWAVCILFMRVEGFPRSVIFIYWFIAFVTVAGGRLTARYLFRRSAGIPVAIYGAGDEGVQLATALQHGAAYHPVLFLDDRKELYGSQVMNLQVHSPEEFGDLQVRHGLEEILITVQFETREERNRVVNNFKYYPVRVKVLPLVSHLAQGRVSFSDFERISAEDLLGRDAVPPDERLMKSSIERKSVMVTGAGGSIGSELCRQIVNFRPSHLVLYEQSESALYKIEQMLRQASSGQDAKVNIVPVLGSVLQRELLEKNLQAWKVRTIYHAAAYKHVPLVEINPVQGVLNNTFGTKAAAEAAMACKAETFVFISTDKAVHPRSMMGASKRLAEMILQALGERHSSTCFSIVRFGNVLDSSGSVVPLFRRQIEAGGPITLTHQNMMRYFMTVQEAVELVIQAGSMAQGGEVFVLDMGKPVRIDDLARTMVYLSGLRVKDEDNPDGDIEIRHTGIRPGEKLAEELVTGGDTQTTGHVKILRLQEDYLALEEIQKLLEELETAVQAGDTDQVFKLVNNALGGSLRAGAEA